jgi:hypothetical protein
VVEGAAGAAPHDAGGSMSTSSRSGDEDRQPPDGVEVVEISAGSGGGGGGYEAEGALPPTQVVPDEPLGSHGAPGAAAAGGGDVGGSGGAHAEAVASAHHAASSSLRTEPRLDGIMAALRQQGEALKATKTGPHAPAPAPTPPGPRHQHCLQQQHREPQQLAPTASLGAGGTPARRSAAAYARVVAASGVAQLLEAARAAPGCLELTRSHPALKVLRWAQSWAPFNVVLLGFEEEGGSLAPGGAAVQEGVAE